jgi:hypothetical protein
VLAGLFLLRVFIEQFAKSKVNGDFASGDALLDAYPTPLPDDFKGRFPSLKNLYSGLSMAIH